VIPDSFKQDLLNRIDVVELIERYVPLKKGGANYAACCPFHSEKSPSFTVSPTKQFYHCFGCGAHGNAISFLMEYQGLGYIEALKELAESVGMKLPELERGERKEAAAGPDLYELMERASRYYREQLKSSPQAIEYLKRRGLTGKIAARFGIGYAPAGWQNLQSVFTDYDGAAVKEAGLVIEADGGRRYDRFRDRIVFPILNQRGSVIGFGGRVLGQGEPKYLNSPETPLFEKGRELYGLPQARNAIRAEARALVTEGYMDVVALAQHGVEYAVATLGTATSAVHVQKLFRMTDEIVFCFDGDAAGRRAAWHALEVALPVLADDKAVRFMFLPEEDDPDSFVRARGQQAFQSMVAEARPLSEFLLAELRSRVDMGTAEGRSRLIAEARPLLRKVAAPALQLQLLRQLAGAAELAPEELGRLTDIKVGGNRPQPARFQPSPGRSEGRALPGASLMGKLERQILAYLLVCPRLAQKLPRSLFDAEEGLDRTVLAVCEFITESVAGADTEARCYSVLLDHFASSREHLDAIKHAQQWAEDNRVDADFAEADFEPAMELRREKIEAQRHGDLKTLIAKGKASADQEREFVALSQKKRASTDLSSDASKTT
jgi:DNA primase